MDAHIIPLFFVLIVLYGIATGSKSNTECGGLSNSQQSFNLSIVSKRSSTGKWITNFVANKVTENETDSVILDLKQNIHHCEGRQIVSIQGTIHENPEIATQRYVEKLIFDPKCGKNVAITNFGRTVQKLNHEDGLNSVVFTNRPLRKNELFEVRVDSKKPNKGHFFGIGFTTRSARDEEIPAHINYLRPIWVLYHANVYINGNLFSKGNKKNIDTLQVGDRVGIKRSDSGALHLYVNGVDEGPMASNIPEVVYGVFEVYGDMGQYTLMN